MWQPPAAKEGQGDCDFPLGPPWILLYPLKRRRSAEGLEAAGRGVLARRSALLQRGRYVALRSSVALRHRRGVLTRRSGAGAGAGVALRSCREAISSEGSKLPSEEIAADTAHTSLGAMEAREGLGFIALLWGFWQPAASGDALDARHIRLPGRWGRRSFFTAARRGERCGAGQKAPAM